MSALELIQALENETMSELEAMEMAGCATLLELYELAALEAEAGRVGDAAAFVDAGKSATA